MSSFCARINYGQLILSFARDGTFFFIVVDWKLAGNDKSVQYYI